MSLPLFQVVLAETRNACTRRCWFCKFGQERTEPATIEMPWDMIHRILRNLADLDFAGRISWFHINEPLLDKRIIAILEASRHACPRAILHLNTNGDRLTAEVWEKLRGGGLDSLAISVYDDEALEKAAALPCQEKLTLIDMRCPENKIENRGGNIKTRRHVFAGRLYAARNRSCERPFNMLTIRPTGDVVLCCADMYGDVVMGNAGRHRLEVIWNGEPFQRYRQALSTRGRQGLRLCENCTHDGTTSTVGYPFDASPQPPKSLF